MIRIIFFILLASLFSPLVAQGGEITPRLLKHDGFLRLYHSHSREFLEVTYESNGVVDPSAVKRIDHFMRSRDSGKEIEIDPDLIRLIDHLQDHFGADTVEVICGYRTPDFNRALKAAGKNVAEQSNHMNGIAADIHLDEISEKKVQTYARRLGVGGVGYYPDQLMVHVDLGRAGLAGRVHSWQSGNFSDRTDIGIFNDEVPLKLKTDHLFYFPGDRQRLTLSNPGNLPLKSDPVLEHFFRGDWRSVKIPPNPPFSKGGDLKTSPFSKGGDLKTSPFSKGGDSSSPPFGKGGWGGILKEGELRIVPSMPHGKFRWKIATGDGRVQYSNEFYVKKK